MASGNPTPAVSLLDALGVVPSRLLDMGSEVQGWVERGDAHEFVVLAATS